MTNTFLTNRQEEQRIGTDVTDSSNGGTTISNIRYIRYNIRCSRSQERQGKKESISAIDDFVGWAMPTTISLTGIAHRTREFYKSNRTAIVITIY